jgi:DNA anti-recombination protein RmuC
MKTALLFALTLSVLTMQLSASAQSSKSEAVSPEHFAAPDRHRPFARTGRIVEQYIQEKTASGEIDPSEYQALKTQRQTLRQELRSLRQSGDQAAVDEKMQALRNQQQQQRDYVKDLVSNDPQLKQRIEDNRDKVRRHRLQRRHDMIERRLERLQDRRQRDEVS